MPNIETLGAIITDCGGDLVSNYNGNRDNRNERADKNVANEAYQACYKEKGFTSNAYWSSTTVASDSSNVWSLYFNVGADGWVDKAYEDRVRCVRGGH